MLQYAALQHECSIKKVKVTETQQWRKAAIIHTSAACVALKVVSQIIFHYMVYLLFSNCLNFEWELLYII